MIVTKILLTSCIYFCLVTSIKAANNIGSSCLTKSREAGFCRFRQDCLHAVGPGKQPPTHCSRKDGIICCPESTKMRLSEKKCQEYHKNNPPCGKTPLIIGGTKTEPGEYPHMAAIGYKTDNEFQLFCGGTLISDRFVLTAAHCASNAYGENPSLVRLGVDNFMNQFAGEYYIESFIKYPEYVRKTSRYNDIALIKLQETVVFDKRMKPSCLWQTDTGVTGNVTAIGFGAIGFMGVNSDDLLKVVLTVQTPKICDISYPKGKFRLPNGFQNTNQICVGELISGGKDTCQGDSGGPIHKASPDGQSCIHYVAGITSFGKPCGIAKEPSIYTRVSSYLDWIENVVWST